jgi:hypothetical protein
MKYEQDGKNYIMKAFTIFIIHQKLFGALNQGE